MIKLLAIDMDGTCLNSKGEMADETLSALKKAAQSGVMVVPTTGRNFNCLPYKLKNESFYRYAICSNGAVALDLENNTQIHNACIDTETACEILDGCKHRIIFISANINKDCYTQGKILHHFVKKFFKKDAVEIKYVKSMKKSIKKEKLQIEKFQFFFFSDKHGKTVKSIADRYEHLTGITWDGSAEVFCKNAEKGVALLALAKHLGISKDEIGCIGDEENDISMFEVAAHRFAMGNAKDKLKSKATKILPSNDENGVAHAVYNYILTQEAEQ